MKKSDLKQMAMASQPVNTADDSIHFDSWWYAVSKVRKFPTHLKEILWADFKARGLQTVDSKAAFDRALKQFGY